VINGSLRMWFEERKSAPIQKKVMLKVDEGTESLELSAIRTVYWSI
jgi:hypothetical protein